jgi:hypothetical protein
VTSERSEVAKTIEEAVRELGDLGITYLLAVITGPDGLPWERGMDVHSKLLVGGPTNQHASPKMMLKILEHCCDGIRKELEGSDG